MTFSLIPFLPELTLLAALVLILLATTVSPSRDGTVAYGVTQLALWVAVALLWLTQARYIVNPRIVEGVVLRNSSTLLMQSAALIGLSLALLYGRASLIRQKLWQPETFLLFLCSTLGVVVVIGAYHFVPLYLGLELMALPLYAMVALRKDDAMSVEAGLKYFFLGALASGFMLYGISLIYGATGSLGLAAVGSLAMSGASHGLLLLGLFFLVSGLAFKLSAVPFHMWAPDVYRGAPTVVALFISTVPKLAAVVLLLRLMSGPLSPLLVYWQGMLAFLAVLSMIVGAVAAIAQTNLKRMLAYSTIGHMGYLLLGALVGTQDGFGAAVFYILTYVLSNLVAFGVLLSMNETSDESGATLSRGSDLEDFRGLYKRSPIRAALMTLAMLSLAGVPPLLGFYGKFAVIAAALMNGFIWLSVVAILTSVIAAYYYLRVIRLMFFSSPDEERASEFPCIGVVARVVLVLNGVALLVLGLFPSALLDLTVQALAWARVL
ncbi:MAG: NADH-quinone oxidoreductase subunit N [Betaproteobacteria bacterium]|nr:NADH-quinone oxidoreductase subunit N [Betaproteobacteria bacterium]